MKNNIVLRTVLFILLLFTAIAPLAAFAPLMILLLIVGVGWLVSDLFQVLVLGKNLDKSEQESN